MPERRTAPFPRCLFAPFAGEPGKIDGTDPGFREQRIQVIQFPERTQEAHEAAQGAPLPGFSALYHDAPHTRPARQLRLREVLIQTLLSEPVSDNPEDCGVGHGCEVHLLLRRLVTPRFPLKNKNIIDESQQYYALLVRHYIYHILNIIYL